MPREPLLPPMMISGRHEWIERVILSVKHHTPMALIGVGGIGKSSIILSVLHDNRVKEWFGDCRWFIHCDQFPASRVHFLHQLSKVIGAGVENPEDLTPLRQYLSSKKMFIVLDNAESILDPQGTNTPEIYEIVDELTQFSNICLCLTSRVSTIPPRCEALNIPTLSKGAALDTFYRHGGRSDSAGQILEQFDFRPLSVTILVTVARHNKWDLNQLTRELERQQTGVLRAQHSRSLATAIKLSLSSPMFRELGPDACTLLEVVAFFPQGVAEENVGWFFSTIFEAPKMFDTFCILSLTYRSNGFITMLAPLRDHFRPKDPMIPPLLNYFAQLSADIDPDWPSSRESRWIMSEDVNVEHLLDVFTSLDPSSEIVWDVCAGFLHFLHFHKPRLTILGSKIEALSDDHPYKARCLHALAFLSDSVGDRIGGKRLRTRTLKIWRERGGAPEVAGKLSYRSEANRMLHLEKEVIEQVREALGICERLGDTVKQAKCLVHLGWALYVDRQFDAAEAAALRGIELLPEDSELFPEDDEQYEICQAHRLLGNVYTSKGETEKAGHHFEIAFRTATTLSWSDDLVFWYHYSLAETFFGRCAFDAAHDHVERARLHADNGYALGLAMELQAKFWFKQRMFERAKLGASRTANVYTRVGATKGVEDCRELLRKIDGLDTDGAGELLCHLSRALTYRFKVGKPTESTRGRPDFFRPVPAQVTDGPFHHPPPAVHIFAPLFTRCLTTISFETTQYFSLVYSSFPALRILGTICV